MAVNKSGWTPATRRAWEYVSQHPEGVTVHEVEAALKISRRGASDALDNLYAQRYLRRVKSMGASKPAFFYLDPGAPEPPPTRPTRAMLRAEARLHPIVKAIPQQVPERVSLGKVSDTSHTPAAVAPLTVLPTGVLLGIFRGNDQGVPILETEVVLTPRQRPVDGNHESLPAAKRGVGDTPKLRGVERANLLSERWLCKIDESHGPEISAQGYCARCERLYGPIS